MAKKEPKKYDFKLSRGLSLENSFIEFNRKIIKNEQASKQTSKSSKSSKQSNKAINLKQILDVKQIIDFTGFYGFTKSDIYNNLYINKVRNATLTIVPGQSFFQLIRLMLNAFYMSGYHESRSRNKKRKR